MAAADCSGGQQERGSEVDRQAHQAGGLAAAEQEQAETSYACEGCE